MATQTTSDARASAGTRIRKKTIRDIDPAGQAVLIRVDFNVPLDGEGAITDDRRIRMALPTIASVIDRGGRAILVSHLGRPGGNGYESELTLAPIAERLSQLLGDDVGVHFVAGECTSDESREAVEQLEDGEVLLLDNLRFLPGEKNGEAEFAAKLAAYGDIYCNDAFGAAHRNDASMLAVPEAMTGKPRVAGLLLEKELTYLSGALADAERRGTGFIAILGGAKVSDKMGALRNLAGKVNDILIGGAMAYTFLKARGESVGGSRVEEQMLTEAGTMLGEIEESRTRIHLPSDHRCAREFSAEAERKTFADAIEDGWIGLDIGPATREAFATVIGSGRTIVWNGPMGVTEMPPFDAGTKAVAEAIVAATDGGAVSVVGGGDSAAAVERLGLAERFSHVSTGGGASLQMLEGRSFDSVGTLDDA